MTQNTPRAARVHILPAKIKPKIYHEVQDLALKAHRALGCRGVSRADFRWDETKGEDGELVCLEVNTQPGMTETSLVPEMAAYAGLSSAIWWNGWWRTLRAIVSEALGFRPQPQPAFAPARPAASRRGCCCGGERAVRGLRAAHAARPPRAAWGRLFLAALLLGAPRSGPFAAVNIGRSSRPRAGIGDFLARSSASASTW